MSRVQSSGAEETQTAAITDSKMPVKMEGEQDQLPGGSKANEGAAQEAPESKHGETTEQSQAKEMEISEQPGPGKEVTHGKARPNHSKLPEGVTKSRLAADRILELQEERNQMYEVVTLRERRIQEMEEQHLKIKYENGQLKARNNTLERLMNTSEELRVSKERSEAAVLRRERELAAAREKLRDEQAINEDWGKQNKQLQIAVGAMKRRVEALGHDKDLMAQRCAEMDAQVQQLQIERERILKANEDLSQEIVDRRHELAVERDKMERAIIKRMAEANAALDANFERAAQRSVSQGTHASLEEELSHFGAMLAEGTSSGATSSMLPQPTADSALPTEDPEPKEVARMREMEDVAASSNAPPAIPGIQVPREQEPAWPTVLSLALADVPPAPALESASAVGGEEDVPPRRWFAIPLVVIVAVALLALALVLQSKVQASSGRAGFRVVFFLGSEMSQKAGYLFTRGMLDVGLLDLEDLAVSFYG